MNDLLIELNGVTKNFRIGNLQTKALNGIELKVKDGEFLSLHGPSGCGKSTLLSIIGFLDIPTAGNYIFDRANTAKLSQAKRARLRNLETGFIFQSFNLINDLTIFENVELPLVYQKKLGKKERCERVMAILDEMDMSHRAQMFPMQLSGGQQQRVAIARAVVGSPSIILADEPTGNLDSQNASTVLDILDRLNGEGATIIMATHDTKSSERASRIVEILDGKIVDDKTHE